MENQNKELLRISNAFINQPLSITAKQYDLVMYIGWLLQKQNIDEIPDHITLNMSRRELIKRLSINQTVNNKFIDNLFNEIQKHRIEYKQEDYLFIANLISVYIREHDNITLSIHKEMAKLFLELKNKYTVIDFNILLNLSSIYSKRAYLLFMQYRNMQNHRTFFLDDFKRIMSIEDKYSTLSNIKIKILNKIKDDINAVIPAMNVKYTVNTTDTKDIQIHFTFDFSFIKQEPQPQQEQAGQPKEQEEEKSAYEKLTYAEPPKRRQVKIKPPTLDEIYEFMEQKCAMIDAEQFYCYYEDMGWLNEYGNPLSWRTKILDWRKRVQEGTQEYKDNVARFKNWQNEYWNREKYAEMTEKLKPFNITSEKFIKAIVNSKMEHLFNFEKGCFKKFDESELEQEERQFINYWSEYKEKDNTELRPEDLPF